MKQNINMKTKLYSQLLDILSQYGVTEIFGVPGDAINPLIEALRKQDKIRFIHVVHEEAGAFAASAQAKVTGNLAVCVGTNGPGAIHLINGLYDAKMDNAPVLAITGQIPSVEMGFSYHQEIDLDHFFDDVSVFQNSVYNSNQMPRIMLEACNAALHNHGVSVLTIPTDIGATEVDSGTIEIQPLKGGMLVPEEDRIEEAVQKINKAEKVAILYGEGCRYSVDELEKLAEKINAPMVFSFKAKDLLPGDHPYVAGGLGLLGDRGGVEAIDNCQLLLVVGSDFPYRDWYPDTGIIRIDTDGCVFGRRTAQDYGIIGDSKVTLSLLLDKVNRKEEDRFLKDVQSMKKTWGKAMNYLSDIERSSSTIHPQAVVRIVSELAEEDAIITCDTGTVTAWTARHFQVKKDQRLTASFNLGSMAYAFPAAMGLQLRFPDRQLLCLCGDGAFNMLMGDFLTAVKYNLPIKVIIFNNKKLSFIKVEQEVEGYPEHEVDLHNPDYVEFAGSCGATGVKITDPAKLEHSLKMALEAEGPVLIDVHVEPDELTFPPRIELSQAWGFSKAKIKEFFGELVDEVKK